MRLPGAPDSVKMACGENPKRVYGKHKKSAPATRMGNAYGHRKIFAAAKRYMADNKDKAPSDIKRDASSSGIVSCKDEKNSYLGHSA